jgi:hypothetical protein
MVRYEVHKCHCEQIKDDEWNMLHMWEDMKNSYKILENLKAEDRFGGLG